MRNSGIEKRTLGCRKPATHVAKDGARRYNLCALPVKASIPSFTQRRSRAPQTLANF